MKKKEKKGNQGVPAEEKREARAAEIKKAGFSGSLDFLAELETTDFTELREALKDSEILKKNADDALKNLKTILEFEL